MAQIELASACPSFADSSRYELVGLEASRARIRVVLLIRSLTQAGGVYAINQALSVGPYTSMSIAIFGSNSIVVLLLAAVIEGRVPTAGALLGI